MEIDDDGYGDAVAYAIAASLLDESSSNNAMQVDDDETARATDASLSESSSGEASAAQRTSWRYSPSLIIYPTPASQESGGFSHVGRWEFVGSSLL